MTSNSQQLLAFGSKHEVMRIMLSTGHRGKCCWLGAVAQHCLVECVRQMLTGPAAAPLGQPSDRLVGHLFYAVLLKQTQVDLQSRACLPAPNTTNKKRLFVTATSKMSCSHSQQFI